MVGDLDLCLGFEALLLVGGKWETTLSHQTTNPNHQLEGNCLKPGPGQAEALSVEKATVQPSAQTASRPRGLSCSRLLLDAFRKF